MIRHEADQSLTFSAEALQSNRILYVPPSEYDKERITAGEFLRHTELISAVCYYWHHPDNPLAFPEGSPILEAGAGAGVSSAVFTRIHDGEVYAVDDGSALKHRTESLHRRLEPGEEFKLKKWSPIEAITRLIGEDSQERLIPFDAEINRFMTFISSEDFPVKPNLGGVVMTSPPKEGFNPGFIQRKEDATLKLIDNFVKSLRQGGKIVIIGDGKSALEQLLISSVGSSDNGKGQEFSLQTYNAPKTIGRKDPQPGYDYPPEGSNFDTMINTLANGRDDLEEVHEDAKHGIKALAYQQLTVLTKN